MRIFRRFGAHLALQNPFLRREFAATTARTEKPLPPRPKLNHDEFKEIFLKGSGPGGQKINKTSSAVQLIHEPTGIVVKAQDTRSRAQNRSIARKRLAEAIELREKGDQSRIAIKAAAASKKKASAIKKSRRKYRALGAEKETSKTSSVEPDSKSHHEGMHQSGT